MEPVLTHEIFAKHANSKFQALLDEQTSVELELTDVSDLKLYPHQEEFAIVFRGPLDKYLGQGLCSFSHDQMGRFEIFLVPIKQDAQGLYYEAVFNRIRE